MPGGAGSRRTSRCRPMPRPCTSSRCSCAGAIGAASARVMVATVVQEEPLGIAEVLDILDEASQVIAYSHKLEEKSSELEAATRGAARGQRAADRARPPEGRLHVDGDARAAHAADIDPRAVGDPARRAGARPGAAHEVSRHHHQGERAPDAPHQPGARSGQARIRRRRVARRAGRHERARRGGCGRGRAGDGGQAGRVHARAARLRCRR